MSPAWISLACPGGNPKIEVSVFGYNARFPAMNVDPTFVTATFATMLNDAAVPRSI